MAHAAMSHTVLVLLSRWRVNLGFAGAVAALLFAGDPTHASVLRWLPLALAGLGLRLWARGHLERRTPLAVSGPYALVRHPLYVGSFLMGLAFAAMTNDVHVAIAFVVVFLLMYVPKAIREEAYLHGLHGPAYSAYAARVGVLLPSWSGLRQAVAGGFTWRRVLRHREYETWGGAASACIVLWLRAQ